MKNMFTSFSQSFSLIKKDRVLLILSLIPILIGMVLYYFAGSWFYSSFIGFGETQINKLVGEGSVAQVFSYILVALLTVGLYFLVNWTFVLVVSIIASPFNDLMSSRVEKLILGQKTDDLKESLGAMAKKILWTVLNETKKISLILTLTGLAAMLSLIPVLSPISFAFSGFLLSIEFLDYCWGRHELSMKDCIQDSKTQLIPYTLTGCIFLFLMAIPLVNLFLLPYGVVYYSTLWTKNRNA